MRPQRPNWWLMQLDVREEVAYMHPAQFDHLVRHFTQRKRQRAARRQRRRMLKAKRGYA